VSLCSRVRGWGDGGSSERGRESGFVDGGIRGRIESLEREGWCIRRTGGGWGDRAGHGGGVHTFGWYQQGEQPDQQDRAEDHGGKALPQALF
jgi:hypothetical protein